MIKKIYNVKPYKACFGYKYRNRRKYYIKLIRPISFIKHSQICNCILGVKEKVRFVKQILRWFKKRPSNYNIGVAMGGKEKKKLIWGNFNLKKNRYLISDGDFLSMSTWMYKSAWKKLLSKLKLNLLEYKILKKHKYNIFITFFIRDIEMKEVCVIGKYTKTKFRNSKKVLIKANENQMTLDIICKNTNSVQIFITLGYASMRDLNRIITLYNFKIFEKEKKEIMEKRLKKLREEKIYYWERREGETEEERDARILEVRRAKAKIPMWWQTQKL